MPPAACRWECRPLTCPVMSLYPGDSPIVLTGAWGLGGGLPAPGWVVWVALQDHFGTRDVQQNNHTVKGKAMPLGNVNPAHEYSGHLYPQPAPGRAPDSSILQNRRGGRKAVSNFNICPKPKELQWKYFPGTPGESAGQYPLLWSESVGLGLESSGSKPQGPH